MSLLAIQGVSKRYREPPREFTVLDGVTLHIDAGELVVIYGARRSGRTTLLRIASGIESPDAGAVTFRGVQPSPGTPIALGNGLGYVRKSLRATEEQDVLNRSPHRSWHGEFRVDDADDRARRALRQADASHAPRSQSPSSPPPRPST